MELKTLKDIYPYMEDKNGKYIKIELLKAEAVKWFKELEDELVPCIECGAKIEFIKHFFNLTEEELK